ncbi:MAG: hypothetical protein ABI812_02105 [Betaproteobacteria bacterium]
MRTMLSTMVISGTFAISGAAWACGDMADNRDDSFAQMTKPQPVATAAPLKKSVDAQRVAQRDEKRAARATAPAALPVKVATVRTE